MTEVYAPEKTPRVKKEHRLNPRQEFLLFPTLQEADVVDREDDPEGVDEVPLRA